MTFSTWAGRKYGTDHDGYLDAQAEARSLHYDAMWDAAAGSDETDDEEDDK